jgi:hypothetical protein
MNSCDKWTFHIFRLSPRERTGAASLILEAESPVVRAVLAFDVQFRGSRLSAVAGQLDTLVKLPFQVVIERIGSTLVLGL